MTELFNINAYLFLFGVRTKYVDVECATKRLLLEVQRQHPDEWCARWQRERALARRTEKDKAVRELLAYQLLMKEIRHED